MPVRLRADILALVPVPGSYADALHEVMQSLKAEVRGMDQPAAEGRLVDALRQRDLFLAPHDVTLCARQLADPWWTFKHPLRARKDLRRWSQQEDPGSAEALRQADEVSRRIGEVMDDETVHSWSMGGKRTFDGMQYDVVVRPYSDDLARRIRDAAAPIAVTVRADDAPI